MRVQAGGTTVALFLALAGLGGCHEPPAVLTNEVLAPDEQYQKLLLSPADEAEVLAAMRSTAAGRTPVNPPAPAPMGVRWSDIPIAVAAACGEPEVQMAVVQTTEMTDAYRFRLRTVEGWPGELAIRRGNEPQVYRVDDAWIGRFPQHPQRLKRRDALLAAFERHLNTLGGQRWFNDEDR